MNISKLSLLKSLLLMTAASCFAGAALAPRTAATPKISFTKNISNEGLVTIEDFKLPGTQPNGLVDEIQSSVNCSYCHGGFDPAVEPYDPWRTSMMANAMRDPIFHACLAIAEQDAKFSGDSCLRCHSPGGWLSGHSTPTDGSAMKGKDYDGVSCHVCHRMVNPQFDTNTSPADDEEILLSLQFPPAEQNSGNYVVDPRDRRRGPFNLGDRFYWHEWRQSPFHQQAQLCGTCHDVSNPAFSRVGGASPSAADTYILNDKDTPHPTQLKIDQFPLERTFSEWSQSAFAQGAIDMGGASEVTNLLLVLARIAICPTPVAPPAPPASAANIVMMFLIMDSAERIVGF